MCNAASLCVFDCYTNRYLYDEGLVRFAARKYSKNSTKEEEYALLDTTSVLCNRGKIDFVYLVATVPGLHSGDQVHKVKKNAAPRH